MCMKKAINILCFLSIAFFVFQKFLYSTLFPFLGNCYDERFIFYTKVSYFIIFVTVLLIYIYDFILTINRRSKIIVIFIHLFRIAVYFFANRLFMKQGYYELSDYLFVFNALIIVIDYMTFYMNRFVIRISFLHIFMLIIYFSTVIFSAPFKYIYPCGYDEYGYEYCGGYSDRYDSMLAFTSMASNEGDMCSVDYYGRYIYLPIFHKVIYLGDKINIYGVTFLPDNKIYYGDNLKGEIAYDWYYES